MLTSNAGGPHLWYLRSSPRMFGVVPVRALWRYDLMRMFAPAPSIGAAIPHFSALGGFLAPTPSAHQCAYYSIVCVAISVVLPVFAVGRSCTCSVGRYLVSRCSAAAWCHGGFHWCLFPPRVLCVFRGVRVALR